MENKINIAKILKDCPKGMELDCPMYNKVTLLDVDNNKNIIFPIRILREDGNSITLTKYGQCTDADFAKCVIFPKGKTTWEGFRRPFVEGDIVSTENGMYIGIVKFTKDNHYCHVFCSINDEEDFVIDNNLLFSRFATENEKQKLFNAIKENGYKWNDKTKTLEKLTEPIFKDGDILAINDTVYIYNGKEELSPFPIHHAYVIADKNGLFEINTSTKRYGTRFATEEEKNILFKAIKNNGYEWHQDTKSLVKFFKPFDKVLVRDDNECVWKADFYSHYVNNVKFCHVCAGDMYTQCIPYNEEIAHLVGTNHDCPDKYKTWKDE